MGILGNDGKPFNSDWTKKTDNQKKVDNVIDALISTAVNPLGSIVTTAKQAGKAVYDKTKPIMEGVNNLLDNLVTTPSSNAASPKSGSGGRGSGSGYVGAGSVVGNGSNYLGLGETDDPFQRILDLVNQTTKANNEWSAAQAQKQMDFQKMMSDTAHVREVADLKAAGLNPVLSAGGSGAQVTSGAMGDTDTSNSRVVADIAIMALDAMQQTAEAYSGGVSRRKSSKSYDYGDSLLGKAFGTVEKFYDSSRLGKKMIDTGLNSAASIARSGILKLLIK